jgi:hypothetical protein
VGILGAITFYGTIALFIKRGVDTVSEKPRALSVAVIFGLIAGTIGMFFNATYIDVFAASKVSFMYWAMLGMGYAILELTARRKTS